MARRSHERDTLQSLQVESSQICVLLMAAALAAPAVLLGGKMAGGFARRASPAVTA